MSNFGHSETCKVEQVACLTMATVTCWLPHIIVHDTICDLLR